MNPIIKKSNKKAAFTIIELLTVMSIIVILIGLLIPSLNMVRRYAKSVRQKAQLGSIGTALELFSAEHDGYPPSERLGSAGEEYCGAMKLAEAMMGQDLLGFHPNSRFRSDGTDGLIDLYPAPVPPGDPAYDDYAANLKSRKGPYLQPEYANANKLKHLYGVGETLLFTTGEEVVLCDVYSNVVLRPDSADPPGLDIGRKSGMPILYYRADTSKTMHQPQTDNSLNIYNSDDNQMLLALNVPGKPPPDPTGVHRLFDDPKRFYVITRNEKVITPYPCRADSYILISAGFDGEYGTEDDVFNFQK